MFINHVCIKALNKTKLLSFCGTSLHVENFSKGLMCIICIVDEFFSTVIVNYFFSTVPSKNFD